MFSELFPANYSDTSHSVGNTNPTHPHTHLWSEIRSKTPAQIQKHYRLSHFGCHQFYPFLFLKECPPPLHFQLSSSYYGQSFPFTQVMREGMHELLTLDISPNVKYIICINIKNKHLQSYKRLGMLGMGWGGHTDTSTKTSCAWVFKSGSENHFYM